MNYPLDFTEAAHPLNGPSRSRLSSFNSVPFGTLPPSRGPSSPTTTTKKGGKLAVIKGLFRTLAELEPSASTWTPRSRIKNSQSSSLYPQLAGHPSLVDINAQEQLLEQEHHQRLQEAEELQRQREQLEAEVGLQNTEAGHIAAEANLARQRQIEEELKEVLVKRNALYEQRLELMEEDARSKDRLAAQMDHRAEDAAAARADLERNLAEEKAQLIEAERRNIKERILAELEHEKTDAQERIINDMQAETAGFKERLMHEMAAEKTQLKERVLKELLEAKERQETVNLARLEAEKAIREEMSKFKPPDWLDLRDGEGPRPLDTEPIPPWNAHHDGYADPLSFSSVYPQGYGRHADLGMPFDPRYRPDDKLPFDRYPLGHQYGRDPRQRHASQYRHRYPSDPRGHLNPLYRHDLGFLGSVRLPDGRINPRYLQRDELWDKPDLASANDLRRSASARQQRPGYEPMGQLRPGYLPAGQPRPNHIPAGQPHHDYLSSGPPYPDYVPPGQRFPDYLPNEPSYPSYNQHDPQRRTPSQQCEHDDDPFGIAEAETNSAPGGGYGPRRRAASVGHHDRQRTFSNVSNSSAPFDINEHHQGYPPQPYPPQPPYQRQRQQSQQSLHPNYNSKQQLDPRYPQNRGEPLQQSRRTTSSQGSHQDAGSQVPGAYPAQAQSVQAPGSVRGPLHGTHPSPAMGSTNNLPFPSQGRGQSPPHPISGLSNRDLSVIAGDPVIRRMVLDKLSPIEQQELINRLRTFPNYKSSVAAATGPPLNPKQGQNVRFAPGSSEQNPASIAAQLRSPNPSLLKSPSMRANYPGPPPSAPRHFSFSNMPNQNSNMQNASPRMPPQSVPSPNMQHSPRRQQTPNSPSMPKSPRMEDFNVYMRDQPLPGPVRRHVEQIQEPPLRDVPPQVSVAKAIMRAIVKAKDLQANALINTFVHDDGTVVADAVVL